MNETPNNPRPTATQPTPTAPDISAEPATSWVDWTVVIAVLAVSVWYLYRKLWARRGDCGGCAKGRSDCAVQRGGRRTQANGVVQVPINRIDRGK